MAGMIGLGPEVDRTRKRKWMPGIFSGRKWHSLQRVGNLTTFMLTIVYRFWELEPFAALRDYPGLQWDSFTFWLPHSYWRTRVLSDLNIFWINE